MFLRFLVIVDSYQEKISCIATQRIRIFLFLNLLHRSLRRLVPLQLHNKRRIVISVLRFWNENEVCEAPACLEFAEGEKRTAITTDRAVEEILPRHYCVVME